jgi:hypothetical protein
VRGRTDAGKCRGEHHESKLWQNAAIHIDLRRRVPWSPRLLLARGVSLGRL